MTYEALQDGLERPVTLTLLAPGDPRAQRFRADAWPEHEHVVSLYSAGPCNDGFFIATRWIAGAATLRQRVADGADPAAWLADVRATLAATGAVHGALDDPGSLLIDRDGRVLITGFGLAAADTTADDDERALARLMASSPPSPSTPSLLRRRGAATAAAAGVAALLVVGSGDDGERLAAPAPGAIALGSALAAGSARATDCEGAAPSERSLACTALQTSLPGRTLVVARDGVVVAWHVRGARGDVALRVIRPRDAEAFGVAGGSEFEPVDAGLRSFSAAIPVRRGDRLGLEVAPGSAVGVRIAVRGATTARFIDPLGSESRAPNTPEGAGGGEELLLRVDYVPGKATARPVRIAGAAAAAAPGGRRLAERELALGGGETVPVALVALDGEIAIDVFGGTRRRARITVPGADPRGRAERFTAKGEADLTLAWRNPDGTLVETPYRVTAGSIAVR